MYRPAVVLLALALATTACSSVGGQQVGTTDGTAPTSNVVTTTSAASASTTTVAAIPGGQDAEVVIDPAAALLADTDVPTPWELTGEGDFDGYDIGPNQADCDRYWSLQRLSVHPVRNRLWFQPGANLDHEVFDTGVPIGPQYLAAAEQVPETCSLITWNEGGTLTAERLELGLDGVVAVAYTSDIGEVEWYAYATRANLVSRLRYVHFGHESGQRPPPPHGASAEFKELVARMVQRLDDATASTRPTPSTTTSPLPPPTLPAASATTLESALVTAGDLGDGYRQTRTDTYDSIAPDGEWIPGCEASRVINVMNGWFTLERLLMSDGDGPGVQHLVGQAPTESAARAAVASVAGVPDCDLSADVSLGDAILAGGAVPDGSGGPATYLQVGRPEQQSGGLIVAYHAHDVIGVLILTTEEGDPPSIDDHLGLLQSAAARAVLL